MEEKSDKVLRIVPNQDRKTWLVMKEKKLSYEIPRKETFQTKKAKSYGGERERSRVEEL